VKVVGAIDILGRQELADVLTRAVDNAARGDAVSP
jgi:hypothetical protein